MTKTYIQIDLDNIQTSEAHEDGSFTSGILRKIEGEWYSGKNLVDLSGEPVQWLDEAAYQAEQDAIAAIQSFKSNRQHLLDTAIVTTTSGKQFDANEVAKSRMSDAIKATELSGMVDTDTLQWSLADTGTGVMSTVTVAEIKEAFVLAVVNMSNIWGV